MDLRTRLGKVEVEGVIGPSPGPRKTLADCHEVGRCPAAGMIMVGSLTVEERPGNPEVSYWSEATPWLAQNSLGLPNKPVNLTKTK